MHVTYVGYDGEVTHSFLVNTNNFDTITSLYERLKRLLNYFI